MQIIIAVVALLMWGHTASAQKEYSLSVSRHQDVPELSQAEVNAILDAASKMLQTNPGVACNVKFTLRGAIGKFGSPNTSTADIPAKVDAAHIDAVHRVDSERNDVDFHVKLVEEIKPLCRIESQRGFNGCSWPHAFRSIIVVHPKLHKDDRGRLLSERFPNKKFPDHLLWAHEFGHLTGLDHHQNPPDARMTDRDRFALMSSRDVFFFALEDSVDDAQVNRRECDCFVAGLKSCEPQQ